jgi:dolichyl-phosphate-mannose--protein O-mannosyl transferase
MTLDEPQEAPAPRRRATTGLRDSELARRLSPELPTDTAVSWWVTIGITVFATILRFVNLGQPHAVSFDETYYMKDAWSLLRWGYERGFVTDADKKILASNGDWRTLDFFTSSPAFIVHPPVGKWTIGVGEYFFGLTPFGWRFMTSVLGCLMVLLVIRIARRLSRSTLIGAIAGFLMAIDCMAIVMSRTGLLDNVLAFWVLAAFGCILMDRERTRRLVAREVLTYHDDRAAMQDLGTGTGPFAGLRPWRWAAGFALGMACGTKWSGVWFVIAFGLLTVVWDFGMRRMIGVRTPNAVAGSLIDGVLGAIAIAGTAIAVYLVSWSGWLLSDGAYDRNWAAGQPGSGLFGFMPEALRSLWHYHAEMLNFHTHLTSTHSYQSNAWSWPLQARPTSFYYESFDNGESGCTADKCSSEVLALGNPIIWWAAIPAVIHQAWRWISQRDWRSGAVVLAVLAGWLPWLGFQGRTIFTFYAVVYVAFLTMALALSCGTILGKSDADPRRRTIGAAAVGSFLLLALVACWFFYPIWTAEVIPYSQWQMRMWFPTWV